MKVSRLKANCRVILQRNCDGLISIVSNYCLVLLVFIKDPTKNIEYEHKRQQIKPLNIRVLMNVVRATIVGSHHYVLKPDIFLNDSPQVTVLIKIKDKNIQKKRQKKTPPDKLNIAHSKKTVCYHRNSSD